MEKLKIYLKGILKNNIDTELFARILIKQATQDYQEIRSQYTKSGNTVIFHFSDFGIEL